MRHNSIYTSNLTCQNKDFNKDFTPSPAGGGGFKGGPGKGIGAAFGAPVMLENGCAVRWKNHSAYSAAIYGLCWFYAAQVQY